MKQQKKKTQRKKWMRKRHAIVTAIGIKFVGPFTRWKYGVDVTPFKEQGDRQYLIVMNHQTVFDQFFIAMAFKGPVYYIATEDLFSNGWISKVIRFLVAPVPIKKQTNDVKAVYEVMRLAREGGTIALAPEGNRTYSGRTEYIKPSIVKMAKAMKLPIAIFRIEDGYGVQPRWSDKIRKGKMRAYVSKVVEPEEYKTMTDDELYRVITDGLAVDEACVTGEFHHKNLAEYLERAVYVCPECGLAEFESHGDVIECKKCNRKIQYLPTKELKGIGFDFPFRFVADWYQYQCDFVNQLDPSLYHEEPMYKDTSDLWEVILYKNKQPLHKNVQVALYGNRIVIRTENDTLEFPFDQMDGVTVLGRNKLNIYYDDHVYQLKGNPRFNALKYVNIYHRYKNISEGNENGQFLGL